MKNWLIFGVLLVVLSCLVFELPPYLYLAAAFIFFAIGNSEMKKGRGPGAPASRRAATGARSAARPSAAGLSAAGPSAAAHALATAQVQLPERPMPDSIPADLKCPNCGANIKPTDSQCSFCGSSLQPLIDLPEPAKLGRLEVRGSVTIVHPQRGRLVYRILGRLLYTELWQATRGPNVAWTPTGNYFAGFPLEPAAYLLNWQERFYLLEQRRALTDSDINRDFAPAARQFSQSDQTAKVEFNYAGARWRMVDIGRFAIEFEQGEGAHLHKGAIGRFIHSSSGSQALVVEDFQSGGKGGQDTLWQGLLIQETDILF